MKEQIYRKRISKKSGIKIFEGKESLQRKGKENFKRRNFGDFLERKTCHKKKKEQKKKKYRKWKVGEYEKMMMNNKSKGIAVRTGANNNYSGEDEDEDDDKITSPSLPSAKSSPRNASSKYDFVKVISLSLSNPSNKLILHKSFIYFLVL